MATKTNIKKRAMLKTNIKKRAMLKALEGSLGIVTSAAKKVDIDRCTHYKWLNTDEDYAEKVKSIEDMALDFAESMLMQNMKAGKETSNIFFLKTKGKKRGYIEKQEIEVSGKPMIQLIKPE